MYMCIYIKFVEIMNMSDYAYVYMNMSDQVCVYKHVGLCMCI